MIPAKRAAWLFVLLLWLSPMASQAGAVPPMVFRHLTVDEGLAQNTVFATLQDAQGFLWIATQAGLDRYDGFSLRHFTHQRGTVNGLPTSYVYAITQDREGNLWLAVKDGGVVRFDPRNETFQNFRHQPNLDSLSSDAARQLLVDQSGRVWVATTDGGLNVLDPVSRRVQRFRHDPTRPDSLNSDTVGSVTQDQEGRIWVGTDAGLDLWLPDTQGFRHFAHRSGDPRSLSSNTVATVYVDRDDVVWVGTYGGGLNRLDRDGSGFTVYSADAAVPTSLNDPEVRAVFEDADRRFWVGTAGGLHLLDRKTGLFTRFVHDKTDPQSLRDNYVVSLYQDRGGLLWVGTVNGGVSRWNPRSWLFGHVHPGWGADAYANSFADDGHGGLWVGTQGAGLFLYTPETGDIVSADSVYRRPLFLPDKRLMALLRTRMGDLWVGTMGAGLIRIAADGHTTRFPGESRGPDGARALGANGIMALYEARDGRIWVGTFRGGLAIIDPHTDRVQRVSTAPLAEHGQVNPPATSIVQDRADTVWVGTDGGGLLALRPDGSLMASWRHREADLDSLASDTVYALHVDGKGRLWVGSDNAGIDQVVGSARAPANVRFRNHADAWGSSDRTIYGIRSDESGALWIAGNQGLMRYEPDSGDVRRFHRNQGMQGEEFNLGAHFRMADGRMVFGGSNGFNLFDPREVIAARPNPPPLALTAIELRGQPARIDSPLPVLGLLTIGYRDDVAAFEFAALDFGAPELNRYEYRLHGFDDRWMPVRSGHRATFTNLDSGDYELEVRAATPDGEWSARTLSLPIVMRPAPWRSKPAYALYGAVGLLMIWSYLAAQRRKLRVAADQAVALERQVESRTEELRTSNVELQRLSRAKSDFLARMSHEIRTPMNGIIGMGEMLLRTNLSEHQLRLARTVHRSAKSLMQILNDILDLSKVEAGRLSVACEEFDLTSVMVETAELFAAQAHDKKIELIVSPAPNLTQFVIGDPMRVRQILMNLVGNALKFSNDGEISIVADVIDIPGAPQRLSLAVKDSGIGMRPEVVARVFEPFTQGDESTTRQFGGTGLGLAICRELVELMGGVIHAASELHVGSTFTVTLPLVLTDRVREPDPPTGGTAVIVTRRPALAQAVRRQCELLGTDCRWLSPAQGAELAAEVATGRATVVIDVEGCADQLTWLIGECVDREFASRCTFLGAASALAGLDLARRAPGARMSAKPLGPRILRRLLETREAATTHEKPTPPKPPVARLQGRVLVVEDNPVNTAVFEGLLEELGCTCETAATGREAQRAAAAQRFDAILMDIHMPDMDGWSTTALIRQAEEPERRTPIVALTADAAPETRRRCIEAGMDDFLSKPLSLDELRSTLARWLPVAAAATATAVLSEKTLARINDLDRAGNRGFLKRITTLFVDTSARQVDSILESAAGGDLAAIRRLSHSLKSAAAHVGADGLAQLLLEIERAANTDDAIRVELLAGGLRAARDAAVGALRIELHRRTA